MDLRAPRPDSSRLTALESGDLFRLAMGAYREKISIYDGPTSFLDGFAQVSPAQGHLFASFWADAEICNGGLHQFFLNPTGVLAPEAVRGLRFLEIPAAADIVESAIARFDSPYPREEERRAAALRRMNRNDTTWEPGDIFHELDEAYYAAMGSFDMRADDFVRRNMDLYFIP